MTPDCHPAGLAPAPHRPPDLQALRARIAGLEHAGAGDEAGILPFGIPAIDGHLPWGGLPLGALHEVVAAGPGDDDANGAAVGFAAVLLARLAARGPVLWVAAHPTLYAPGLAAFAPAGDVARMSEPHSPPPWTRRLIVVRARGRAGILWTMEEALRTPGIAAVLAEVRSIDLKASRRLQLAAESAGATGLLLRPATAVPAASAALTRWRLAPAPSLPAGMASGVGWVRWRAELLRCRGGRPGDWLLEWCDETGDLAVAPELRHRPAVPAQARLAV